MMKPAYSKQVAVDFFSKELQDDPWQRSSFHQNSFCTIVMHVFMMEF